MTTRQIVARAAGVIVAVGALLGAGNVAQATEQSGNGSNAQTSAIEGVWLPIVTITDCQTQAVIATFPSMEIYVRGGGYVGFGAVRQSDQIGMGGTTQPNTSSSTTPRSARQTARQTGRCSGFRLRSSSMPPVLNSPAPRPQTWSTPQGMCSRKSAEKPELRRGCNSRH